MAEPLTLAFSPDAVADIKTTFDHYAAAEEGLGERFRLALDEVLRRLEAFPRSAPVVDGYEPIRRALIRGFPYAVLYRPADDIEILRVMHTARSAQREVPGPSP